MEYRAGKPREEVGIDGCGLSSLARTFARCTRTSGYEFDHRAGPDADARVSKPGSGAAHKGTLPVPSTDPPPPAHATALGHRYGGMGAHAAAPVALSTSPERLRDGAPEERDGPEPQSRWRVVGVADGYSGRGGCAPAPRRDQRHAASRATNFIFPACRI